jgi:mono/diheme cytochrome c family protein
MHERAWMAAVGSLLAGVTACGDDGPTRPVTYWQDVAPIYAERCVACHRPTGIAPFRLDTYAEARQWAAEAAHAVEERIMPPYLVTADGSCGSFHEPQWLSDAEIATIAAWVETGTPAGMPAGEPALPPARPPGAALDDGSGAILTLSTPEFVPELQTGAPAEHDEYRCFLLDAGLDADRFLTGYEVIPGNDALVHHAVLMVVDPAFEVAEGVTNLDRMSALDQESPDRAGWPCYAQAGEGVAVEAMPVIWAPGLGVVSYPAGTGLRLSAGRALVMQVHYNLASEKTRGQSDITLARLRLADEVQREGVFVLLDEFLGSMYTDEPATLPPGRASVPYTWTMKVDWLLDALGSEQLEVLGVAPHMHELGRRFRFEIVDASGAATCGAEVERWDFDWQLLYFYEQPLALARDAQIRVTCEYDTRGRTTPARPGWGTEDEMCLAGLYLVSP